MADPITHPTEGGDDDGPTRAGDGIEHGRGERGTTRQ